MIVFIDLSSFSSKISSAITTSGSLPKPTVYRAHAMLNQKPISPLHQPLCRGCIHLPPPQHRHFFTRFFLCTATLLHRPYLFLRFQLIFQICLKPTPKFFSGELLNVQREINNTISQTELQRQPG